MSNNDSRPGSQRPRLVGSSMESVPMPGPDQLPVVDGGGIPDDAAGISEMEAAAMLAGLGDPEVEVEMVPVPGDAAAANGDVAIPMADEPEPIPATSIPIAEVAPGSSAAERRADDAAKAADPATAGAPRFRAIGVKAKRHEDDWNRTPNATGQGAIHVRTFMSKLTEDGFHALDARINEWLDAHPQYEVKFVNTSIGVVTGKIKEPHLICQVWV